MSESKLRPNILLIMTDQQRWDTLGCYGAETCRTPNLDALAGRGVRFDAAYTPTSPCSPARAALFSGIYPFRNHVPMNGGNLNPENPNLATELGGAGYNLGYAGKWHVDQAKVPTEYGFKGRDFPGYGYPPTENMIEGLRYMQRFSMPPHYRDYLNEEGLEVPEMLEAYYGNNPGKMSQEMYALQSGTVEQSFECMVSEFAIDLLKAFAEPAKEGEKPFFVWANFWGPHTPCFVPEPYYSMYDPAEIEMEPSFCETWENKPTVHDLYERTWGLRDGGWKQWREIVARYWGYCTMIDDLVGNMLNALEELGLAENTIVVYTTDHGDMMGAHRMIEKGPFAYEESWRLPMVVAHPDCENPGSSCDEFVYLHDLYATFLDVAGLPAPVTPDHGADCETRSILPNMLGREAPTGRDCVYGVFTGHILPSPMRFVRTRNHKFVYNQVDIGELYDLRSDPAELYNLIDLPETKELQDALMERMHQYMVGLNDPLRGPFETIRYMY